ncbi:hypothetical protein B0H10DRAFT_2232801 [Mycena sp. CBHHK59/15]|nr:hypothetical protein B0H10DRAFT_2232801 [Mycena sp. CBHHK59/15]
MASAAHRDPQNIDCEELRILCCERPAPENLARTAETRAHLLRMPDRVLEGTDRRVDEMDLCAAVRTAMGASSFWPSQSNARKRNTLTWIRQRERRQPSQWGSSRAADARTVDAAGEVDRHRYVGPQPQPHRVDQWSRTVEIIESTVSDRVRNGLRAPAPRVNSSHTIIILESTFSTPLNTVANIAHVEDPLSAFRPSPAKAVISLANRMRPFDRETPLRAAVQHKRELTAQADAFVSAGHPAAGPGSPRI